MNSNEIFKRMIKEKYVDGQELLYDVKAGYLLSGLEYNNLLDYKDELVQKRDDNLVVLDLKSFNNKPLFYSKCNELKQKRIMYLSSIIKDYEDTDNFIGIRNEDEITRSRIFSELEGNLNVEAIPTTRKRVEEIILKDDKLIDKNDIIIKNMANGIEYVFTKPEFNEENLYHLYNILSKDCLDSDDKLRKNDLYRYDEVDIDKYKGCPSNKIKECMDSLFSFVNKNIKNKDYTYMLPHIVHYYILYIHPYFDYNGRTARMVSLWICLLMNDNYLPMIVSEAINQTKNRYYLALENTRNNHNDLTYFLIYLYDISLDYLFTYKNIENISLVLQNDNKSLSNTEKNYLKKIMLSCVGKFTYEDFIKWSKITITKQGALKILNHFVEYNILTLSISNSRKNLYELNYDVLSYATRAYNYKV